MCLRCEVSRRLLRCRMAELARYHWRSVPAARSHPRRRAGINLRTPSPLRKGPRHGIATDARIPHRSRHPFQQNCSILWCSATRRAAIVDPGGDIPKIEAALAAAGVTPEKSCSPTATSTTPVQPPSWRAGSSCRSRGRNWRSASGSTPCHSKARCSASRVRAVRARSLAGGWRRGDHWRGALAVLHCPGHTPGHVVFFSPAARLAVVGDVLFAGSIGRTDFPRGDHSALVGSIREKLWPLGDDVRFIPGHGPMSSLGVERSSNPFVGDGV